jgi:rod shape-determining protein MreD
LIFEKVAIACAILLAHILNETTLFNFGANIKPDFVIILVVFFALRKGELAGLWIGFLGGLLSDSSLGGEQIGNKIHYKIGLHSLSYSTVGYLLGKFGRGFYNENYVSTTFYTFVLTFIMRWFTYILFSTFFYENDNYSYVSCAIYNAAIAPVTFFGLSWVFRLEPVEGVR